MEFAPDPFAELTLEQLAAVNDACDRFEAALRDTPPPRVEDFLAGCGGAVRDALLRELLILAFEDEVSRHGAMDVVGTAERFPDDRAAVQAAAHEACNYAALRHEPGANPGAGGGFPEALDGFRLKAVLGRGAFGTVFLADAPDGGEVALKVPHLPVLISPDLRQRFLREAEAAGGLDHPNLIAVRAIREAGLVCFTVSDYVPGGTLADWLRGRRDRGEAVPPRLAAGLIAALAGAIHYAHGRGVLHCDLKPANVLLRDARPDAPLVTDFGVARLVGQPSDLTQSGQILGTLAYMAPEQADGRRSQVTAGTDVYGLGAILYELLTCHPPFPDEGLVRTLRRVLTEDPIWPQVHAHDTPPGLEAICLKCLEKSPARRYASANDLAADLTRYLDGLSPSARHPGVGRRLSGWTRRHPRRAAAAGFALLSGVVILAAVAAAWAGVAAKNRDLAEALGQVDQKNQELEAEAVAREGRARRLRARVYADDIRRAEVLLTRHDLVGFRRLLDAYRPGPGEEDLRGFEWHYLDALAAPNPHRILTTKYGRAYSAVLSPDARLLAIGCQDGMVRLLDPDTGQEMFPPLTHPGEVRSISFAPGGDRVATACADGGVRVWPVGGREAVILGRHDRKALAAAFSPDGRRVASGGQDGILNLWDLGDGASRQSIRVPFESQVRCLAWTSDGQTLVTGQEGEAGRKTIKQWDTGGRLVASLDYGSVVGSLVVVGSRVVIAARDGAVDVWEHNAPMGKYRWSLTTRLGDSGDGRVNDLAVTRDGAFVAVVREAVVEVWRGQPLRREIVLRGHDGRIWAACFADGGKALITAGEDGTVRTGISQPSWPARNRSRWPNTCTGWSSIRPADDSRPSDRTL